MFNSNCASVPLVANLDGNNNGMFGGDGLWGLIIILALLGWGGNGFGGFGGFGGNRGGFVEPCATQADVRAAVDQQTLISKLDQQTYGLADSTYALNNAITNGFFGVQSTLCQGFNGIDRAIADCCCTTQRAIDGVNYNMATQACDIKHAINDSTRSILDFLTTDKIATLQAENQSLKLKASQAEQNAYITANQSAQTAELIRRLGADCPTPAYLVPNPNCCYNAQVSFGNNCGCGSY
jgi:hypothetical protein